MTQRRLVGMSHYRGTSAGLEALWLRGEVRDITDESAAYLETTFPGCFAPVEQPGNAAPDMSAPPVDRKLRSRR